MASGAQSGETYQQITQGICVRVQPQYLADQSDPAKGRYVWAYHVDIRNDGEETVQLRSRKWRITDGNGKMEEVVGPGVVGEQPILNSGDSFQYTSGCPLTTPSGFMVGSYTMQRTGGQTFEAQIPAFSLDLPGDRRRLN
ncbi:MAG: Co2+/Mg2+ efflux protein ApaG [Ahrensia sp.]|nr:Co2+/Mg2+ efflux protein ApaG [Ahrensia sp.]